MAAIKAVCYPTIECLFLSKLSLAYIMQSCVEMGTWVSGSISGWVMPARLPRMRGGWRTTGKERVSFYCWGTLPLHNPPELRTDARPGTQETNPKVLTTTWVLTLSFIKLFAISKYVGPKETISSARPLACWSRLQATGFQLLSKIGSLLHVEHLQEGRDL